MSAEAEQMSEKEFDNQLLAMDRVNKQDDRVAIQDMVENSPRLLDEFLKSGGDLKHLAGGGEDPHSEKKLAQMGFPVLEITNNGDSEKPGETVEEQAKNEENERLSEEDQKRQEKKLKDEQDEMCGAGGEGSDKHQTIETETISTGGKTETTRFSVVTDGTGKQLSKFKLAG